jgi:two-component system LytT family sensor kinase
MFAYYYSMFTYKLIDLNALNMIVAWKRQYVKKKSVNDRWIRIIGIPIIIIILIVFGDVNPIRLSAGMLVLRLVKITAFIFCYWEGNRIIFEYMRCRYPNLEDISKRLCLHALVFLIYVIAAGFIFTYINRILPQDRPEPFWSEYRDILEKSLLLLGLITVIYECSYYFGLYEKSQYESERLKKEALISQVALITMVPEDPTLSVLFIQKLSNVYRHILNYDGKNMIDLQSEKNFLDDYIFLHQIRFNANLIIKFQLPERLYHLQVIPFTLQMLVENAIKHNIISNRKPLTISIVAQKKFITVSNNLQKKTSGVESTNTGLKNIITRYELLTGKQVDITVTAADFSVSLPLIFSNEDI